jgi:hypothetical protein
MSSLPSPTSSFDRLSTLQARLTTTNSTTATNTTTTVTTSSDSVSSFVDPPLVSFPSVSSRPRKIIPSLLVDSTPDASIAPPVLSSPPSPSPVPSSPESDEDPENSLMIIYSVDLFSNGPEVNYHRYVKQLAKIEKQNRKTKKDSVMKEGKEKEQGEKENQEAGEEEESLSDSSESSLSSSSSSVQVGRRKRRLADDDYDLDDEFIDDTDLIEHANTLESGAFAGDLPKSIDPSEELVRRKRPRIGVKLSDEIQQIFDKLQREKKELIEKLQKERQESEANQSGSMDGIAFEKGKWKKIPDELIPYLYQLEKTHQQSAAAHGRSGAQKELLARLAQILPWSAETLRARMRNLIKQAKKQELNGKFHQVLNSIKASANKEYSEYLRLVQENAKKSRGPCKYVKVKEGKDKNQEKEKEERNLAEDEYQYEYSPQVELYWEDFLKAFELNSSIKSDGKMRSVEEREKEIEKNHQVLMADLVRFWPEGAISVKVIRLLWKKIKAEKEKLKEKNAKTDSANKFLSPNKSKAKDLGEEKSQQKENQMKSSENTTNPPSLPVSSPPSLSSLPLSPISHDKSRSHVHSLNTPNRSQSFVDLSKDDDEAPLSNLVDQQKAKSSIVFPLKSTRAYPIPPESERWSDQYFPLPPVVASSTPSSGPRTKPLKVVQTPK